MWGEWGYGECNDEPGELYERDYEPGAHDCERHELDYELDYELDDCW